MSWQSEPDQSRYHQWNGASPDWPEVPNYPMPTAPLPVKFEKAAVQIPEGWDSRCEAGLERIFGGSYWGPKRHFEYDKKTGLLDVSDIKDDIYQCCAE